MKTLIKDYLELSKPKIMIPVSLTGFTGYFLYDPQISIEIVLLTSGILFLATSASVLNQVQEVEQDGKMNRTHNRPLPSQRIKPRHALIYFFLNLVAGIVLIYSAGNISAVIIGLITILWYNGVYTYAKRITAFAVLPGAVTGALPPLIGWVAAGGTLYDKPAILLGIILFAGQIPHFWLLILQYGEEYEKAGFPSLTKFMSRNRIGSFTFFWIVITALTTLLLIWFNIIKTELLTVILLAASAILIWASRGLFKATGQRSEYRKYTMLLNTYFILVFVILITEKIIR
jgi:heme o synthase